MVVTTSGLDAFCSALLVWAGRLGTCFLRFSKAEQINALYLQTSAKFHDRLSKKGRCPHVIRSHGDHRVQ